MKKKLVVILLTILWISACIGLIIFIAHKTKNYPKAMATYVVQEEKRIETQDKTELIGLIAKCDKKIQDAKEVSTGLKSTSYNEAYLVLLNAEEEFNIAYKDKLYYQHLLDDILKQEKEEEEERRIKEEEEKRLQEEAKREEEEIHSEFQPQELAISETADYIWNFFHAHGLNNYASAGILGNLMAEAGGQTLNIDYTLYADGYYGMVQWSEKYYPQMVGTGLEEQCEFLLNTLPSVFSSYGSNYQEGFTYEDFLNLTNEQEAALCFAQVYERCSSGSYSRREQNAVNAYNHFCG